MQTARRERALLVFSCNKHLILNIYLDDVVLWIGALDEQRVTKRFIVLVVISVLRLTIEEERAIAAFECKVNKVMVGFGCKRELFLTLSQSDLASQV